MKTYVITGGTGKTGKDLSLGLLESGNKVRVICRNPEKAQELKDKGAEIFTGDTRDERFLKQAFSGSDAAYVLLPMDTQAVDYTATQVAHATAIRNAAVSSGVKYAVTLSSVGADLDKGTGVVFGLHKMEALFNQVPDINVKHLRATYFMENTLNQIPSIKRNGVMAGAEDGKARLAMVAAKDITAVALKHLLSLEFSGKSIEYILGQRDVSYNEIADIYGKAIGKPDLRYVQLSYDEFSNIMTTLGMGESAVKNLIEFTGLINNGKVRDFYSRTPENTTPTSIEAFALAFKEQYES